MNVPVKKKQLVVNGTQIYQQSLVVIANQGPLMHAACQGKATNWTASLLHCASAELTLTRVFLGLKFNQSALRLSLSNQSCEAIFSFASSLTYHSGSVPVSQDGAIWPWLVWLSGLSISLWMKRLSLGFPVKAHAWAVGQVSSRGLVRSNHTLMFLSLSFSLPSPLSKNKKFFKR